MRLKSVIVSLVLAMQCLLNKKSKPNGFTFVGNDDGEAFGFFIRVTEVRFIQSSTIVFIE